MNLIPSKEQLLKNKPITIALVAFVTVPWLLVAGLELKLAYGDAQTLRIGEYCIALPAGCSVRPEGAYASNVFCKDGSLIEMSLEQLDSSVRPSVWRRISPKSRKHKEVYEFEAGKLKATLRHSYPEKPTLEVVKPSPCG